MERQLVLLESSPDEWRLDEHTRAVGRRGVEAARAALRAATAPEPGAKGDGQPSAA